MPNHPLTVKADHLPRVKAYFSAAAVLTFLAAPSRAIAHGVLIGRNTSGQLIVLIESKKAGLLPPSPFPGITGYADAEPGIASAEIDQPDIDFFMLDPGCNIQFELLSFDPGLQVVTSHVWVPGDTEIFGQPFFDFHLVFNIVSGNIGETFSLQFRVRDLNGIHGDSDAYTLTFTPAATSCQCRGDVSGNLGRDGRDVLPFVQCFVNTPANTLPAAPCGCADMNGDGVLDEADVDLFVDHLLFEESCST